ncbi:MAG: peptidyl-prolyl cis-trans isomerase [Anaerolineae bacterium]|nr:peptidyl-prolyl cis-trans isomerase [Anaerolineae bacterium]
MFHHYITRPLLLLLTLVFALILAACDSDDNTSHQGYIHIDESGTQTAVAITQVARANPSPTPGPSPTPLPTLEPYNSPTPDPDMDQTQVIMRVGRDAITLAEFQQQVRFERWRWLYQIVQHLEQQGTPPVLDLNDAANEQIAAVFTTVADTDLLGSEVQRIMIIDAIITQEARRRGIDVDPYQFNAILAQYLGLSVNTTGELPPEFDAVYADFLASMTTYTGLTEEEFRRIIRARTLYEQLQFIIMNQPETNQAAADASTGVAVHDLLLATEDLADEVVTRLQSGETLDEVAASLGFVRNADQAQHIVRRDDDTLPDAILSALFAASPGAVVGPFEMTQGWYVAVAGDPVFDLLSVEEVNTFKQQIFLDWVEAQMDDPDTVQAFANWRDHIPTDPQPRDLSPLLSDANVIWPGETAGD